MARSTIDVGIDLGTTNSAIARMQQGVPFVIPTNDNSTFTPSVVRINSNGAVAVGREAYAWLEADPQNTKGEFKRVMGTDEVFRFEASGRELTAPQLSAEVLKRLRGDLGVQGEPTVAAVITVPAAFELNQCAATQEAAGLAGFEQSPLLQEPIAASLAYGYRVDLEGGAWLVYDFGGGTFDLALVGVREGRVHVIDHEGDNFLGGKDMDRLIVERILVPRLSERFNVTSLRRDNVSGEVRAKLAVLKYIAEQTKIGLSREDRFIATIETLRKPLLDDDGKEITADVIVSRNEYEQAIRPLVERTISLCRLLLARNADAHPEAVLMVGGPTLTPFVRSMVASELGLRVDTSANPITAVAEGAALFAASQPLDVIRPASAESGSVALDLVYKSVTDSENALIGGKVPPPVSSIEFLSSDGSWSSGALPTPGAIFSVRLALPRKGLHEFNIIVRGPTGSILRAEPKSVSVTRGLTAGAAPMSSALGVVVEDSAGGQEVQWLIPRNAPLPAAAPYEFRTAVALEPGGEIEVLEVHLVEGRELSSRPERQRRIGTITITDRQVKRRVPAGSPIEVRIQVNESRILSAEAYLPVVDQKFEVQLELGADVPEPGAMAATIAAERGRLASLAAYTSASAGRSLHEALADAEQETLSLDDTDFDSVQQAHRSLQSVQRRIDELEDAQRLPMAIAGAREESEMANEVVLSCGDQGHAARVHALVRDLDEAVQTGSVIEIRRAESKLTRLRFEVLTAQPGFWMAYLDHLSKNVTGWTDTARADGLMRQGRAEIVREDIPALRNTCLGLLSLVRPEEREVMSRFQNVGLRR